MDVKRNIDYLLRAKGMKWHELGLKKSTVDWCKRTNKWTTEQLHSIATALGVEPYTLLLPEPLKPPAVTIPQAVSLVEEKLAAQGSAAEKEAIKQLTKQVLQDLIRRIDNDLI